MIFKKPKRFVDQIFLHHSATDNPHNDNIEFIKRVHVDQNKWSDVGYHFFIDKNGGLSLGRSPEKNPAAQKGYNTHTIAICLSGNYNFTDEQFVTLEKLLYEIQSHYKYELQILGHKDVMPTECPRYDYPKILNLVNKADYDVRPKYFLRDKSIIEVVNKPEIKTSQPQPPKEERLTFIQRIIKFIQNNF